MTRNDIFSAIGLLFFLVTLFMFGCVLQLMEDLRDEARGTSNTLQDVRAINSEMRDALNCQTWTDEACK